MKYDMKIWEMICEMIGDTPEQAPVIIFYLTRSRGEFNHSLWLSSLYVYLSLSLSPYLCLSYITNLALLFTFIYLLSILLTSEGMFPFAPSTPAYLQTKYTSLSSHQRRYKPGQEEKV
jgi:hypothetical protein